METKNTNKAYLADLAADAAYNLSGLVASLWKPALVLGVVLAVFLVPLALCAQSAGAL